MAPVAYHNPHVAPASLPACVEEQEGTTSVVIGNVRSSTINNNDRNQANNSYYTQGNQELAIETALTLERLEAVRILFYLCKVLCLLTASFGNCFRRMYRFQI